MTDLSFPASISSLRKFKSSVLSSTTPSGPTFLLLVSLSHSVRKIVEIAAFQCGFARELQLSADRAFILDELADQIEYRN